MKHQQKDLTRVLQRPVEPTVLWDTAENVDTINDITRQLEDTFHEELVV